MPIAVTDRKGRKTIVELDEHPRADVSEETLSTLKPVMRAEDSDATVTAGNASGQNDAAAMCIVTTRERAESMGLEAFGRIVSWAVAGVPPSRMGIGPVPAVEKALGGRRSRNARRRPNRAQRGVRIPSARVYSAMGVRERRLRAAERPRLGNLAWAPSRGDGRADHDDAASGDAPKRSEVRP